MATGSWKAALPDARCQMPAARLRRQVPLPHGTSSVLAASSARAELIRPLAERHPSPVSILAALAGQGKTLRLSSLRW